MKPLIVFLSFVVVVSIGHGATRPTLKLVGLEKSNVFEGSEALVAKLKTKAEASIQMGAGSVSGSEGVVEETFDYSATTDLTDTPREAPLWNKVVLVKRTENGKVTHDIFVKESQGFLPCLEVKNVDNLERLTLKFTCEAARNVGIAKLVPTFELSFNVDKN